MLDITVSFFEIPFLYQGLMLLRDRELTMLSAGRPNIIPTLRLHLERISLHDDESNAFRLVLASLLFDDIFNLYVSTEV